MIRSECRIVLATIAVFVALIGLYALGVRQGRTGTGDERSCDSACRTGRDAPQVTLLKIRVTIGGHEALLRSPD
ncbi:DUF2964 family protein [Paraburkholderia sacchari]|uniref:DUF2964 family protein n=1 Tax=Paraburkholderia sacchari TaxID=159450 RepID=A0A8T6ZIR0_9BURK|nr:DUF2964 family protein [Paraburkholderia sacchari]